MNKDILLLGNPGKIHHVDYETNENIIMNYIRDNKKELVDYIRECIINEEYSNLQIKAKIYSFVEEYINLKNFIKQDEEIKNDIKVNKMDSAILQEAFMHLKMNKQKTVLESFENNKVVSLVSNKPLHETKIISIKKDKDETINLKEEKKQLKSIDLSGEI